MHRWLVTLSVCVAVIGIASAAGSAAGASYSAERPALGPANDVTPAQSGENATVSLDRSIVRVPSGEETTMELTFQGTDEATVVVGGDDAGDNVTATVTDTNGDGVVPLVFETAAVGTMATRLYPVDDGDDYGTVNASEYGGPLPAGEYPIEVYVGHGVSGEPSDEGTLVVNGTTTPEPTTEPPETMTSPPETTTALPEASIDYEGDAVTLNPRSDQVVDGTTSRRPDRTVTVRLRSSGDSPFLKSDEVLVGEDGGFSATFDLSDVEAPANATAVVTVDGDRVAGPVDVEVVEADATSSPGQPGFGVVAALLGVIVVAVLATGARRRR